MCCKFQICLAYQKGMWPANIYGSDPQNFIDIEAEGKVTILKEHMPLKSGSYAAINNFSYTGSNYHILLKDHHKSKVKICVIFIFNKTC